MKIIELSLPFLGTDTMQLFVVPHQTNVELAGPSVAQSEEVLQHRRQIEDAYMHRVFFHGTSV